MKYKMKKTALLLSLVILQTALTAQTEFETILSQIHADSLKKTVEDLVAFDNRLCCATVGNNKKTAQYIVQRLNAYGIENAEIDSFHVSMSNWLLGTVNQFMYNVRGRLHGNINPDSIVIIGAHLDAICYDAYYIIQSTTPGANDNATGIAIMIEVARIFHANNLTPQYSIDFMAYDAEEIGLCGSKYDAAKRKSSNEKVYVMLNNDMVGMQSEEDDDWKVTFHADFENIENKAKIICKDYTRLQPYIPDNLDSSYRNSDSWAYREVGFKTFYTHEYEDDPNYHSLLDLPQRLNYRYMAEIAKLHFSLLYDWAIEQITKETNRIYEPVHADAFAIFPNPTSNMLQITSYEQNSTVSSISIYDAMGRTVFQHSNIIQYPYNVDVSNFPCGIYYLRIGEKVIPFLKE